MNASHLTQRRSAAALAATTATTAAAVCAALCAALASPPARAAETARAFEQLLSAAQQDKRGVSMNVSGQVVAGAVVRIEPGQWVELRNQQYGRIIVRLDRVDSVAMP